MIREVKLQVFTDKPNAIYKKGECIYFGVFAPELSLTQEITAEYKIQFNRVDMVETGVFSLGSKPVEISTVAKTPGFFNFSVKLGNFEIEAVAGVDPLEIEPSMSCPEDFDKFWDMKKAKLASILLNSRIKQIAPITEESYCEWNEKWPVFGNIPFLTEQIETFDVEVNTSEGNPVRGYFSRPVGVKSKSLPAVLFTHGAGVGDSDFAKSCIGAKYGFLSMDVNAHGLLNGEPSRYYKNIEDKIKAECDSYYKKGRLNNETAYMATMYLRHRRALDFLCAQPEWDGRNLIVRGNSQGGALALVCAGLDNRVSCICAGVPAFCDNNFDYSLRRWFLFENDSRDIIEKVRESVRYFSLVNFAAKIKANAYFAVGFLDELCDPVTIYAAYNAYKGPKKIYCGSTATHSGLPKSIYYDDFTRFIFENISNELKR